MGAFGPFLGRSQMTASSSSSSSSSSHNDIMSNHHHHHHHMSSGGGLGGDGGGGGIQLHQQHHQHRPRLSSARFSDGGEDITDQLGVAGLLLDDDEEEDEDEEYEVGLKLVGGTTTTDITNTVSNQNNNNAIDNNNEDEYNKLSMVNTDDTNVTAENDRMKAVDDLYIVVPEGRDFIHEDNTTKEESMEKESNKSDAIDDMLVEEGGGGEIESITDDLAKTTTNGESSVVRERTMSNGGGLIALPAGFSLGADGNVFVQEAKTKDGSSSGHRSSPMRQHSGGMSGDVRQTDKLRALSSPVSSEDRTAGSTDGGGAAVVEGKKKSKRRSTKSKSMTLNEEKKTEDCDVVLASPVVVSASEAIQKLKATEVSIGEATTVQVKQSVSTDQLKTDNDPDEGNNERKVTGVEGAKSARTSRDPRRGGDGGTVENDDASKLRAARQFNKMVRACVERSDPDGMRKILRDKHNHKFALDSHVLETVLKAYVMAAMFEDALYCLRNCALPGTLSVAQAERILLCLPQNLRNSSAYAAGDMINALCISTHFDQPTSRTYFMRIVRGITLEFLEEATSSRDRICSAPCERLVRSAYCVVDARLQRGKKPADLVVIPGRQLGVFIPDTSENRGMQAGDAVSILPYAGPYPMSAESLDRNMIEATVANAAPLVLRLQDKGNMELYRLLTDNGEGNVYRIDKLANRMGFTRQLAAAVSVVSPSELDEEGYPVVDRRHPSAELIKAITAMDENIDRVMMAGGKFNAPTSGRGGRGQEQTSTATICSRAVPWSSAERDCDYDDDGGQELIRTEALLALEKYGALEGLNASQRLAVQGAASNRLTLVQGRKLLVCFPVFPLNQLFSPLLNVSQPVSIPSHISAWNRKDCRGYPYIAALGTSCSIAS
jgi:hypothetical protein